MYGVVIDCVLYCIGFSCSCAFLYIYIIILWSLVIGCNVYVYIPYVIIESVDSISRDERGFPLTQYITNGRISRAGYTITYFKHYHRVLRLISYRMSV